MTRGRKLIRSVCSCTRTQISGGFHWHPIAQPLKRLHAAIQIPAVDQVDHLQCRGVQAEDQAVIMADTESQGVGSTGQTELSRGRIAEACIVSPPSDVQVAFGKIVRPMRLLAVILQNKIANLRTTRDLLLPKLISGELDVSELPEPEAILAAIEAALAAPANPLEGQPDFGDGR